MATHLTHYPEIHSPSPPHPRPPGSSAGKDMSGDLSSSGLSCPPFLGDWRVKAQYSSPTTTRNTLEPAESLQY